MRRRLQPLPEAKLAGDGLFQPDEEKKACEIPQVVVLLNPAYPHKENLVAQEK